jgi:hypothetical protein
MVQLSATSCCITILCQSSEFCCHNPLYCFSMSVFCCKCIFCYWLSPETFGYTLIHPLYSRVWKSWLSTVTASVSEYWMSYVLVFATNSWITSTKKRSKVVIGVELFLIWGTSCSLNKQGSLLQGWALPEFQVCYGLDKTWIWLPLALFSQHAVAESSCPLSLQIALLESVSKISSC